MLTKSNRLNVLTVSLSALLGLAAATGVCTAKADEAPSVTVSYRDLDLARPQDVQKLYKRLKYAAASVCTPVPQQELSRYAKWQRCYNAALDSAVLEVPSPELLALYRSSGAAGAASGRG
jgi:UrcA family protein